MHSLERLKANVEFQESGLATIRVRVTIPGEKTRLIHVQKKLSVTAKELFAAVATEINIAETRYSNNYFNNNKRICNWESNLKPPFMAQYSNCYRDCWSLKFC